MGSLVLDHFYHVLKCYVPVLVENCGNGKQLTADTAVFTVLLVNWLQYLHKEVTHWVVAGVVKTFIVGMCCQRVAIIESCIGGIFFFV